MASAQTAQPVPNTPVVTQSAKATGAADTDSIQSGDQQGLDSVAEKADAPEKSVEKADAPESANDPAGGPDVQDQTGDVSGAQDTSTAAPSGGSR